jgi:hypothetical protein
VKNQAIIAFAILLAPHWHTSLRAKEARSRACPRPSPGSVVPEPEDLRSRDGVLRVDLAFYDDTEADCSTRYCYIDENGHQSSSAFARFFWHAPHLVERFTSIIRVRFLDTSGHFNRIDRSCSLQSM